MDNKYKANPDTADGQAQPVTEDQPAQAITIATADGTDTTIAAGTDDVIDTDSEGEGGGDKGDEQATAIAELREFNAPGIVTLDKPEGYTTASGSSVVTYDPPQPVTSVRR